MKPKQGLRLLLALPLILCVPGANAQESDQTSNNSTGIALNPPENNTQITLNPPVGVHADGSIEVDHWSVPYSDLASDALRADFVHRRGKEAPAAAGDSTSVHGPEFFAMLEQKFKAEAAEGRKALPYSRREARMGGVPVTIMTPLNGASPRIKGRFLLSIGAVGLASGEFGGAPLASRGGFEVISVGYRVSMNPYPAAVKDIEAVYRELLKATAARNIGIFGCSSGADLSAQAVAWFRHRNLPRPGAIGMFGSGAAINDHWGDSNYFAGPLMGAGAPMIKPQNSGSNVHDPLVSPGYSPEVLAHFPPALLITGTRDVGLSVTVFTHAQLVAEGVDAELHVWEGADHCFSSPGTKGVPETEQAWNVMTQFFATHLGKTPGAYSRPEPGVGP
jgi:monoterpene epsilon-lactone hydrolase